MKASELVQQLNNLIQEHGDYEIFISHPNGCYRTDKGVKYNELNMVHFEPYRNTIKYGLIKRYFL